MWTHVPPVYACLSCDALVPFHSGELAAVEKGCRVAPDVCGHQWHQ